jgi:hypothetical protein
MRHLISKCSERSDPPTTNTSAIPRAQTGTAGTLRDVGLGTNLRRLGAPIEVVQRILRHSKASTTHDHYVLPDNTDTKQALEKIEAHIVALRVKQRELAPKLHSRM